MKCHCMTLSLVCVCVCLCHGNILGYWIIFILKPCVYKVTPNTYFDIISWWLSWLRDNVHLLSARRCDSSHCTKFHSLFRGYSWCKGTVASLLSSTNIRDFYLWWILKSYSVQSWFHTEESTIWKKEHVDYNICNVISRTSTCNEQRVVRCNVCLPAKRNYFQHAFFNVVGTIPTSNCSWLNYNTWIPTPDKHDGAPPHIKIRWKILEYSVAWTPVWPV